MKTYKSRLQANQLLISFGINLFVFLIFAFLLKIEHPFIFIGIILSFNFIFYWVLFKLMKYIITDNSIKIKSLFSTIELKFEEINSLSKATLNRKDLKVRRFNFHNDGVLINMKNDTRFFISPENLEECLSLIQLKTNL